jgi:hypothetical protein
VRAIANALDDSIWNGVAAYQFIQQLPLENHAMEMTEHGKHGKP